MFAKKQTTPPTPATGAYRAADLALAPLHQKLRALIQRRDELAASIDTLRTAEAVAIEDEARIAEAVAIGDGNPAELSGARNRLDRARAAVADAERLAGLAAAAAVRAGDDVLTAELAAIDAHKGLIREAAEQAAEDWREVCRQWAPRLALARLASLSDQDPARVLESALNALPRDLAAVASGAGIEAPPRTLVPRDILSSAMAIGPARAFGWLNSRDPEERA